MVDGIDVVDAAKKANKGVPWHILVALAWGESSFRTIVTSKPGAMGLFQIMPDTWEQFAGANQDPYDWRDNMQVAVSYLHWLHTYLSNKYPYMSGHDLWWLVIVAYNWGIGNVDRSMEGDYPIHGESSHFAEKVLFASDLLSRVM